MPDPSAVLRRTPTSTRVPYQSGFSLVELLVALMVVVLITSLVSFSFSSGGQEVRLVSEIRNLTGVANYALDEAQMTGVDFGLLIEEESIEGEVSYSYSWLQREIDGWKPPGRGIELFDSKRFPPGIELELELEDAPLVELSLEDEGSDIITPQIVLYSSGEMTVGAIDVRQRADGELLWRIEWDLLGRFDLLPRGEELEDEDEDF